MCYLINSFKVPINIRFLSCDNVHMCALVLSKFDKKYWNILSSVKIDFRCRMNFFCPLTTRWLDILDGLDTCCNGIKRAFNINLIASVLWAMDFFRKMADHQRKCDNLELLTHLESFPRKLCVIIKWNKSINFQKREKVYFVLKINCRHQIE